MLNLTIRQLRTIVAVARHRKISHAANAIGLTSPAVTIQLKQAEIELGSQLFIREKTGVTVTEAGQMVLDHALKMLSSLDALEEDMKALATLGSGTIRLGVVSTGIYFAPQIIAAFTAKYPEIEVKLVADNRVEIIKRLKNHEIDVALMGRPPKGFDVNSTIIGDHPNVFVANPNHVLAQKIDIHPRELAEHQIIIREQGSGTRTLYELFMTEVMGEMKFPPKEMNSNETIKQAVIAGLGIAFLSGHTLEQEIETGKVTILDVVDTPIRRHWFLVRRTSREATAAIRAFETFLFENGMQMLPIISKPYRSPVTQTSDV